MLLAGQPTTYVAKAARLLADAMAECGHEVGRPDGHGGRLVARPVLAIVRCPAARGWPPGWGHRGHAGAAALPLRELGARLGVAEVARD